MSEKTSERTRLLGLDDRALAAECEIDLYRASGAGGQKRNKTSSAVRMRHKKSGLSVHASESRSQHDNRAKALARLRTSIALDLREPMSTEDELPGDIASLVRAGPLGTNSKTRVKTDYLQKLATVLDVLEIHEAAVSSAASQIGVSTSALGKLLTGDDRLVRRVAEMRQKYGKKPLR